MKIKKIIALLTTVFALLVSCTDLWNKIEDDSDNVVMPVTIKVSMDNGSSRTALPEIDIKKLSYLLLRYSDSEKSEGETIIGEWNSVAEMATKALSFKTGSYTFTFYATNGASIFTDTKKYEIKAGENKLYFTPKLNIAGTENYGKGNLEITMYCNPMKGTERVINLVTCGLYTPEGNIVPGSSEKELDLTPAGKCKYECTDVQSGTYVAVFKFYGDTEKKLPLATYREYATIADSFTSKSECRLISTSGIFSINYELNGGQFVEGYTTPGSYTRKGEEILLPEADKVKRSDPTREYKFCGWYDSKDSNRQLVTSIPSGSTGDKTFYANWRKVLKITFVKNDGSSTQETQDFMEGEPVILKTIAQLGFAGTKKFRGWIQGQTGSSSGNCYKDGDAVTFYEDVVLYADWGQLDVNADSTKDTDGDGLSDYEEIKIWHTDPTSKDTDGDGWTDKEELSLYNANTRTFSPLIADVPKVAIEIAGTPQIFYDFTSGTSESKTESESMSGSSSGSQSNSKSNAHSHTQTYEWSEKLGVKFGWETGAQGTKWSWTLTADQSSGGNIKNSDTWSYSSSQSENWSKSWMNGKSKTQGESKTVTGGKLVIPIKFKNPGNIAYIIKNATITISRIPTDKAVPLELVSTISKDYSLTLAPTETSGQYNLEAKFSNPGRVEQILKYSNGFTVGLATYNISMFKDKTSTARVNDFTEALTEVKAKTASIFIDWGSQSRREAKTYDVAVKNRYRNTAQGLDDLYEQTSLEYALKEILKVPESEGNGYTLGENGLINSFYGVKNKSDSKDGAWYISHKVGTNGTLYSCKNAVQQLSSIILHPGDEVSIIYAVDRDKDGVPLDEEILRKTSDDNPDSDGDGLSDFEEIHGWYSGLEPKYTEDNKAFTNPALKDSDGDGKNDKVDEDPMKSEISNDATLKTVMYSSKGNGTFTKLSFNTSEIPEATVNGILAEPYIYIDAEPTLPFASVEYSTDGVNFEALKKDTGIPLKIGENTLSLQCTAPDEITKKKYKVIVNSTFRDLGELLITNNGGSSEGLDGQVKLAWDSYIDDRCDEKVSGGYIIYIKRESDINMSGLGGIEDAKDDTTRIPKFTENPTDLTQKTERQNTDFVEKKEFAFKLSKEILRNGGISLTLLSSKDYCFYLYAYTGSAEAATYKSKCLFAKHIKSHKSFKGKLSFYAHYVEDILDADGANDPHYCWDVDVSCAGLDLGACTLTEKDGETIEFDVDDMTEAKYYVFGATGIKTYPYTEPPSKFSGKTKEFHCDFPRSKDTSFKVTWHAFEIDATNKDDLGGITAEFKYSKDSDAWSCSWKVTNKGETNGDWPEGCREDEGSFTIQRGQRTNDKKWVLSNPVCGGLEFHFDLGWDYGE